jgi:hypothetical protein
VWSRAGTGSLGAALAALGFALGGVLVEQGVLAAPAARLAEASTGSGIRPWLPSLIGAPAWLVVAGLVATLAVLLLRLPASAPQARHWRWTVTGSALGALGVLAWLTGAPAGWHWGLSITGPSRSLLDAGLLGQLGALNWGSAMLVGLPGGSWASARLSGRVTWRAPAPAELPRRFAGGLFLGVGGTLAGGCNIGNALTGLSVLAVHSAIATLAMAVGVALGARVLGRRVE